MFPARFCLPAVALVATLALAPAASAASKAPNLYVNLGDSYATGYQADVKKSTRNGYADQLVGLAAKKGYRLKLVNFGCGGATTESLLRSKGCHPRARAVGGAPYKATQIAAAESFLKKNRGKVALVTVSISGNDITRCAKEADAVGCVTGAMPIVEKNVAEIAKRLRKAAGPKVRIVGTTYPDVILGEWVTGDPARQSLATLSLVAFQQLLNPTLKKGYAAAKAGFVDVTAATGAYGPFEETTTLAPYGLIPKPVARVCELTFYCSDQDIHARTPGYRIIAELIAATLPRRG